MQCRQVEQESAEPRPLLRLRGCTRALPAVRRHPRLASKPAGPCDQDAADGDLRGSAPAEGTDASGQTQQWLPDIRHSGTINTKYTRWSLESQGNGKPTEYGIAQTTRVEEKPPLPLHWTLPHGETAVAKTPDGSLHLRPGSCCRYMGSLSSMARQAPVNTVQRRPLRILLCQVPCLLHDTSDAPALPAPPSFLHPARPRQTHPPPRHSIHLDNAVGQ